MNTHHHYLRLLRTLALATLTAAAVAACTDDNGDPSGREPLTPPDGADGIPVSFTANINPGSDANPDGAPGTRTVLTPTTEGGFTVTWKAKADFPDGSYDRILIWAAKGNTLTNSWGKTYVPTTSAASSELVPKDDQNKLTLSSGGDWTFRAIYGGNGSGSGFATAFIPILTQSAPGNTEHIAANDFSVATAQQNIAAADDAMPQDINLGFKHKLSALQLRITNQTGEELTVKEIRLSAAGGQITSYRAYDVATGDWKADGEQKSDYLKLEIENPAALATGGTESQDFHMLFFPGYAGTDMTITVITSRGEYTLTNCGAYDGMTFTDGTTSQSFTGATGPAGDDLTREQCVTASAYTSRGFTEPTATTPGWAFDTAATWAYLPWNPAFASFPGITTTETDSYRIRVPQHLSGSGTVN